MTALAPGADTLVAAVTAMSEVVHAGRSADDALAFAESRPDRSAVQAIVLGTLRWYLRLVPAMRELVDRPAEQIEPSLRALLVTAAHQIEYSRSAPEVSVHLAVDAARGLGAGAFTRFRRITAPLLRPGAFAGAAIVFIWSFTELGTPLMFEFHDVTSVQVFNGIREVEASPRPYALVVVMLLFSVGFYLLGKSTLGRASAASKGKASVARAAQAHVKPGTVDQILSVAA